MSTESGVNPACVLMGMGPKAKKSQVKDLDQKFISMLGPLLLVFAPGPQRTLMELEGLFLGRESAGGLIGSLVSPLRLPGGGKQTLPCPQS